MKQEDSKIIAALSEVDIAVHYHRDPGMNKSVATGTDPRTNEVKGMGFGGTESIALRDLQKSLAAPPAKKKATKKTVTTD